MGNYVHSIPGRLRVKTASIKKNFGEAERVARLLKSIPGVQSLDINVVTGSVLVRYKPSEVSADLLLQRLADAGHFEGPEAVNHHQASHSALAWAGKAIGSLALGALEIEHPALAILVALI